MMLRAVCILCAIAGVLLAGPAHAAKGPAARVVVAPFHGPGELAAQARRIVIQVVADRYELLPGKRFAAARRSGASGTPGVEEIVEVAGRLEVDAVVIGEVTRRGRRYRLRIAVHMGADGHEIESVVLTLRRPVVEGADRTALERQAEGVMAAFADSWKAKAEMVRAKSRAKSRANAVVTRRDKEGTLNPFGPDDGSPPEPSRAQGARREAALMAPDATDMDDDAPEADAAAAASLTTTADSGREASETSSRGFSWARGAVTAGGSFVGRQLLFAVDDDIADAMAPTEFENRGASGIVVSAELHPLSALGKLPGELGLTFVFDRTLGVKTDFNGEKLDTVQERIGVGLQVVHEIEAVRDGFAVVAAAGYNRLRHDIDSGNTDIGIPDVDYVYLDAGVGVRLPVVSVVSVFADARYIQVLSAGELEEEQNYGGTDASGMDLDAGIDIAVIAGVGVRAGVKYIRVDSAFDGTGALTQLDADEDADVAGATDTYLGGYLTMGYRF